MADGSIRINCDIDINRASESIDELMSKLNNFKSEVVELKVSVDYSEVNSLLERYAELGDLLSQGFALKIDGDFSSLNAGLEELDEIIENFQIDYSIVVPFELNPKEDDDAPSTFYSQMIGVIGRMNAAFAKSPIVIPIIAKGDNSGGTKEFLENSKVYKKLADNIAYFINTVPVGNKLQDVADSLVGFTEKFNTLKISEDTIKALRSLVPSLSGIEELPSLWDIGDDLGSFFKALSSVGSIDGNGILQASRAIKTLSSIEKLPQDFSVLDQTGKNIHAFSNELSAINLQDDVLKAIGRIVSSVNLLSKTNKVQEDFSNLPKISSNIGTYAMNLTGISMDENVMKSIQVVVSSIRSLSNVQKLPENLGSLPDIGNYINLFSNSIDSLNTTEDNVKILRIVISCIRSLASISKLPEGLETLIADGEYLVKFANSISSIEISDIASKNINLITNVLRVISSWQTKELNLEKTSKELLTFAKSLSQLNFGSTIEESQQVSKNIDVLAKTMNAYSSMTSSMSKKSGELDLKPAAEQIKTFVESLTKLEDPNNILGSIATIINGLNNVSSTSNRLSNIPKNTNNGTKAFGIMNNGLNRLTSGLRGALSKLTSFLGIFKRMPELARNVASAMKGVSSSIKNSATELLSKVRLIKGSITTFISIFKNLSSAYEKQISAETRFETSIKNSSDATKKQIKEIKDLTANYQKLGILGDEVQLTGLQELSTYVENAESIKKLLPVMNDMVAQQFGFNATTENAFTVATALGKVLNGNTDTLKRYGYFFDDTQKKILKYGTEEQRVAVLTNVVSSAVGGMNNAMLNTPTGRIVQLKNYFGDLKESLGELLNFAVLPLVDGIKTVIVNLDLTVKSFTTFIKNAFGIKTVARDINSVLSVNNNKTSDSTNNAANSLDYLNDSAKNAKKSVSSLLSPLDELNIISENTSDSLIDTSDYLDTVSLGEGLTNTIEVPDLNEFKKKLTELYKSLGDFSILGETVGNKINLIISKLNPEGLASKIAEFINNGVYFSIGLLSTVNFELLGEKIARFLNTFSFKLDTKAFGKLFATSINSIVNFARGIITNFSFKNLGLKIAEFFNGFVFTFDPENAAQLLLDCLTATLTTLESLLSNTDFVALGTAIGVFLNTMLTNLPVEKLASTLGDTIDNIIITASSALDNIDFYGTGKKLAKGMNTLTRRTELWRNVAKTFGNLIVGVLELGVGFLTNADFVSLGKSIGELIEGLPWSDILRNAGTIIWEALKGVLTVTLEAGKISPLVSVITNVVGALLAFKTLKSSIDMASKMGAALSTIKTVISGLKGADVSASLGTFGSAIVTTLSGPGGIVIGIATALAGIAISIAEIYKYTQDTKLDRTNYLTTVDSLTTKEKELKKAVEDSNKQISDTKTKISEAASEAANNKTDFQDLYSKLSSIVDETGKVKDGQTELANYYVNELNSKYGTHLAVLNDQIQGYQQLSSEVDKYMAKLNGQSILEATKSEYVDALKNQSKYIREFSNSKDMLEEYTSKRKKAVDDLNKYFKSNGYGINLNEAFSSSYIKDAFSYKIRNSDILQKDRKQFEEVIRSIAKETGNAYDDSKSVIDNFEVLFSKIANNWQKAYDTKEIAERNIKENKRITNSYNQLQKAVISNTGSLQDLNSAFLYFTNDLKTIDTSSIDELKEQLDEYDTQYKNSINLVRQGKLTSAELTEIKNLRDAAEREYVLAKADIANFAELYTAEGTQKLLNSKNFGTAEQFLDFYVKLFGVEHVPSAIKEISLKYGVSSDSLLDAYVLSQPDLTAEKITELVEKLYPNKTGDELIAKAAQLYSKAGMGGLDDYLNDTNTDLSEDKKKKITDKMLELDQPTAETKVKNVLTTAQKDAVDKFLRDPNVSEEAKKIISGLIPGTVNEKDVEKIRSTLSETYEKAIASTQVELNEAVKQLSTASMNLAMPSVGIGGFGESQEEKFNAYKEAKNRVNTLSSKLQSLKDSFKSIGSSFTQSMAEGITDNSATKKIEDNSKSVIASAEKALKPTEAQKSSIRKSGASDTQSLASGIADKDAKGKVETNGKVVATSAEKSIKPTDAQKTSIKKSGTEATQSLAVGISDTTANNNVKTNASTVVTTAIDSLKPTESQKTGVKNSATSLISSFMSGISLSTSDLIKASNIPINIYNKIIGSMNNLTSSLRTSASNFMYYFTDPIVNGMSSLLYGMDDFYWKLRNKWQATMNLLGTPLVARTLGINGIPDLNYNYYPFGDNIIRLAQGAVIPPNNEFMAILGDQKRGINIETPLETMKQAFIDALNEGNYGTGNITIPVYIGNQLLDTLIVEANEKRNLRSNGRG